MHRKVLILSDLHSGHVTGLTPPAYQLKGHTSEPRWDKLVEVQKQIWKWFATTLQDEGPFDHTIVNGDCIDGSGDRSGGTELITTDRLQQADIACMVLEQIPTKKFTFTYGTPYHTGNCEDFEKIIAKHFKAKIGSHEWIKIGGLTLDIKHHLASSGVAVGHATPLVKEIVYNNLWAQRGEQPQADIIIRSHVHSYTHCEVRVGEQLVHAVSTPSLQGYGSKFGARKCSKPVDVGFLVLDIQKEGGKITFNLRPLIAQLPILRAGAA